MKMPNPLDIIEINSSEIRTELVQLSADFYHKNWMPGTAGNLSARSSDGRIVITASGKDKGHLTADDFIELLPDGQVLSTQGNRPSAETSIHQAVYRLFPKVRACLHVHTLASNVVCDLLHATTPSESYKFTLPPLELIKGLGIWDHNPAVELLVTPNFQHVPDIAEELAEQLSSGQFRLPGFLIHNHGVTAWGKSIADARNHLEIFDFIFQFLQARPARLRLS